MVLVPASSSDIEEDRSQGKIISPELWQPLSKKVEVLGKKGVAEHRGVVGA